MKHRQLLEHIHNRQTQLEDELQLNSENLTMDEITELEEELEFIDKLIDEFFKDSQTYPCCQF